MPRTRRPTEAENVAAIAAARNEALTPAERVAIVDRIIRDNVYLVSYLIRNRFASWIRGGVSYDDLYAVGLDGLSQAVRKFDAGFNNRFAAFASMQISFRLRDFVREQQRPTKRAIQVEQAAPGMDAISLADLQDPHTGEAEATEDHAELHLHIGALPEPFKTIIESRLGLFGMPPMTFTLMASLIGVTRACVHKWHGQGLDRLRVQLCTHAQDGA